MIEDDFPALRSAVRDSVIGRAVASLMTTLRRAVATSSATRMIDSRAMAFRGLAPAETIRLSAVAMMTACLATWALSFLVPPYVSTAIPVSAFLLFALAFGAAAAGAETLGEQWSRSRVRRATAWLRGA